MSKKAKKTTVRDKIKAEPQDTPKNLPPRPKDGSRKAEVFDVYFSKGEEAAKKKVKELGLAPGTLKSWTGVWDRQVKGDLPMERPKPEKKVREKLNGEENKERDPFSIYPGYETENKAKQFIMRLCERNHMDERCFHVIEYKGRHVVVPIHLKNATPVPTFKTGDTVFDLTIKNSRAIVTEAGPEQSSIEYQVDVPGRPKIDCVINRYLFRLETPPVPEKVSKTPKAKAKGKRERI